MEREILPGEWISRGWKETETVKSAPQLHSSMDLELLPCFLPWIMCSKQFLLGMCLLSLFFLESLHFLTYPSSSFFQYFSNTTFSDTFGPSLFNVHVYGPYRPRSFLQGCLFFSLAILLTRGRDPSLASHNS